MIALSEVTCREHTGDDEVDEQKEALLSGVEVGEDAMEGTPGEEATESEGEDDEEFGPGGGGIVEGHGEGAAEQDRNSGQPHYAGWIAVEDVGAVEGATGEPAAGHEEKPELVVAGGGEQGQEAGHCEGGGGEGKEAARRSGGRRDSYGSARAQCERSPAGQRGCSLRAGTAWTHRRRAPPGPPMRLDLERTARGIRSGVRDAG